MAQTTQHGLGNEQGDLMGQLNHFQRPHPHLTVQPEAVKYVNALLMPFAKAYAGGCDGPSSPSSESSGLDTFTPHFVGELDEQLRVEKIVPFELPHPPVIPEPPQTPPCKKRAANSSDRRLVKSMSSVARSACPIW